MDKCRVLVPLLKLCLLLVSASFNVFAGQALADKTGVSGFINLGVAASSVETNLFAESSINDLGNAKIDSLEDPPESQTSGLPVILFELAYTWADSKTKVFIGSQLEDAVRFDFFVDIGVRQGTESLGVLGLDVISTPGGLKTWTDPYEINVDRDTTDSTSSGFRASWGKVFGSELEMRYSVREIEIDKEMSGMALGLVDTERGLLRRDGNVSRFDAAYEIKLSERSQLTPRFSWIDRDLDGDAMARDGIRLDLNYVRRGRITYIVNLMFEASDYDEANPVYGREDKADSAGLSFTVFWNDAFGLKDWVGNAGLAWAEEDHDIDFYDVRVSTVFMAMLYRF